MSSFLRSEFTAVGDYRAELGETPVWCDRSQSLLWVDILAQRLLRYWPATAEITIHSLPELTSAALLTERDDIFLLLCQSGIQRYDFARQSTELLCPYPDAPGTRPNEAAIAPDGSLWFGAMDLAEKDPIGGWYRYQHGDTMVTRMMDAVTIPNTLVWFEGKVWFADSAAKRFYSGNARRIDRKKISCYSSGDTTPDGSALSRDGQLINACFGGGCLRRYQINQGELLAEDNIPLPVVQPSCCTFGGSDMKTLFVTSARKQLESPGELDGALLQAKTSVTGAAQHRFIFS